MKSFHHGKKNEEGRDRARGQSIHDDIVMEGMASQKREARRSDKVAMGLLVERVRGYVKWVERVATLPSLTLRLAWSRRHGIRESRFGVSPPILPIRRNWDG